MNKPQISIEESKQILAVNKVSDKLAIIGIRGYYLDSIGKGGENDRNVYDEEIDSLLNNLEPAAQDGTPTEEPTIIPAPIAFPSDSASQPQNTDLSSMQPVPNNSTVGMNPTDEPVQVAQGGALSRWLTGVGGIGGVVTAVKGFASDNVTLIAVGITCGTIIILALIFRTVILDFLRMKLAADPNKYNVK